MDKLVMILLLAATTSLHAQDCHEEPAAAPDKHKAAQHDHHRAVDARGDSVMGFSHTKTKHNFVLLTDGGAIEVRANDSSDAASVTQIRAHLLEIAELFTSGDFEKPLAIHGRLPDGAAAMKSASSAIAYRYEQVERGARVRIVAREKKNIGAVHAFLRFQIKDHRTGDSLEVK